MVNSIPSTYGANRCDISLTSPVKNNTATLNPPSNKIEFTSPLLVNNVNDNVVNFNNDVRFDNKTLFERNNYLSINGNLYLNSESSIYFDFMNNRNNKLRREDVIPIKMAKSKANFLINSTSDLSQFINGERVSSYSSQTGGNSKCTSTIWDIITGKQPPGSQLCKNCCKRPKGKGIIKAVILQGNGVANELVLDLDQGSAMHVLKRCNAKQNTKILLFKSEEDIPCRLVLLNRDLGTTDRRVINNRISNIKATDTRNRSHYEIKSETQPWGHFNNGVVSETEHKVNSSFGLTFTFAYLEYVENETVSQTNDVNHSE